MPARRPIVWVVVGFSLAYSGDGTFLGNLDWAFLDGLDITARRDGGKRCSPWPSSACSR